MERLPITIPPPPRNVLVNIQTQPIARHNSGFGISAFVISIVAFFGWILFLGLDIAVNQNIDFSNIENYDTPANTLLRAMALVGFGINFVGLICGIVGAAQANTYKTLSLLGLVFNLLEILIVGTLFLICSVAIISAYVG